MRVYWIDLWKFVFAILVVLLHAGDLGTGSNSQAMFTGAYTFVEFYFIVSGYLLTMKTENLIVEENLAKTAVRYTIKRNKSIWVLTTVTTIFTFVIVMFESDYSMREIIYLFFNMILEVFYMTVTGLQTWGFNVPVWYISALVMVMPIAIYCLVKYRSMIKEIIAPIVAIVIWGRIYQVYHSLDTWKDWDVFCCTGLMRAIAGMCAGIVCYSISAWLKKVIDNNLKYILFTILELSCYISTIFLSYKFCPELDFMKVFLLLIGISITFTGKTFCVTKFNCSFFKFLGEWQLILYITHYPIKNIIRNIVSNFMLSDGSVVIEYRYVLMIYLIITLVFSLLFLLIINRIKKVKNK